MAREATPSTSGLANAFDLCDLEELKQHGAMAFSFRHKQRGNHDVGVFWDGETIYAIDNWCPHADAFLHEGDISTGRVVCPVHYAVFDLQTGHCLNYYTWDVRAYETEVRDGRVWVHLPDEESRDRVLRR